MKKTFRFCPFCGKELIEKEVHGARRAACECGFINFQNARPTGSAIIVNDACEVLLARRACEPLKDYWNLPGGFLEKDEEPRAGTIRELKEETGVEIEPRGFAGIYIGEYDDPQQGYFCTFNVVYAAKVGAVEMKAADDTSELKFFPLDELPEMAFPHEKQALENFKRGIRPNC